jgi:prevent-host-death family protein
VSTARADLYRLIDQVNQEAEPVTITGPPGDAVLIGEADWQAIQETLHLGSVPKFAGSVRMARAEGVDAASAGVDW